MSQSQAETRLLEAERAQIRAAQAANDTGTGNFSVIDQALKSLLGHRWLSTPNAVLPDFDEQSSGRTHTS